MNKPNNAFTPALNAMKEKRWLEANTLWTIYREEFKDDILPWTQAAKCLIEINELDKAERLIQQAIEKNSKKVTIWLISAEIARHKKSDLEISIINTGLLNCPESWELHHAAAEYHFKTNNLQLSKRHNKISLDISKNNIEQTILHAKIIEKEGDLEQAKEIWLEIANNQPKNKTSYKHLSKIYQAQGNTHQAKRYKLADEFGHEILEKPDNPIASVSKENLTERAIHFTQLVITKSIMGVKSESSRTKLNYAWVIIEPLLHLAIYYFLFGKLLHAGTENYGLFLLCGLVPWMWFSKSISTSGTSIINGQALMLTTNISPAFFPLVAVTQSTLKQLPALLCLLGIGMMTDISNISWNILWLPLIILIQLALTIGLALIIAAVIPFIRDLANLIATGLTLLMFLSGVIFNYSYMPKKVAEILDFNPVATLIASYRAVLLEATSPSIWHLSYTLLLSILLISICAFIYRNHGQKFVRQGMR